jgi:hypothetical protein
MKLKDFAGEINLKISNEEFNDSDLGGRKWREAGKAPHFEEKFHNLYVSTNVIRAMKSRRMRWEG